MRGRRDASTSAIRLSLVANRNLKDRNLGFELYSCRLNATGWHRRCYSSARMEIADSGCGRNIWFVAGRATIALLWGNLLARFGFMMRDSSRVKGWCHLVPVHICPSRWRGMWWEFPSIYNPLWISRKSGRIRGKTHGKGASLAWGLLPIPKLVTLKIALTALQQPAMVFIWPLICELSYVISLNGIAQLCHVTWDRYTWANLLVIGQWLNHYFASRHAPMQDLKPATLQGGGISKSPTKSPQCQIRGIRRELTYEALVYMPTKTKVTRRIKRNLWDYSRRSTFPYIVLSMYICFSYTSSPTRRPWNKDRVFIISGQEDSRPCRNAGLTAGLGLRVAYYPQTISPNEKMGWKMSSGKKPRP